MAKNNVEYHQNTVYLCCTEFNKIDYFGIDRI